MADKTTQAAQAIAAGASITDTLRRRTMPGPDADCPASRIVSGYRAEAVAATGYLAYHLLGRDPEKFTEEQYHEIAILAGISIRAIEKYLQTARLAEKLRQEAADGTN